MSQLLPKFGPRAQRGCVLAFALPFLAIGIGFTGFSYYLLEQYRQMQSWVETPATIRQVDLKLGGRRGRSSRLTAVYDYEFNGRQYTGDRVSLLSGTGNISGFPRRAYREMVDHHARRQPLPAYVDPRHPDQSILYRQLHWEVLAFFAAFGGIFGSVGAGMFTAAWSDRRRLQPAAAAAAADAPWRERSDWAAGQIQPTVTSKAAILSFAAAAVWWWIASGPLVAMLPQFLTSADSYWVAVTLVFPLVGVLLAGMSFYEWARARKYGDSIFELAGETGVVGGQLAGVVRIPAVVSIDAEAGDGFRLRLTCLEEIHRGKESKVECLWQEEAFVTKTLDDPSGRSTVVPVLFAISFDAPEFSRSDAERDIRWELEVSARTAGVDYRSMFVVPVFKTTASREDFELDRRLAADFAPPPDSLRVLRDAGLRTEPLPDGGTRIVVPLARNWGSALLVTFVVAGMAAGVGFMIHFGAMILWPILLALFTSVFAYIALDLWFYRSTIDASPSGLTVRGGLFGIGPTRRITPKEFTRVTSKEYMSSGRDVWYTIQVKPRKKNPVTLAKGIRGKLLERAIIDTLATALARNSESI